MKKSLWKRRTEQTDLRIKQSLELFPFSTEALIKILKKTRFVDDLPFGEIEKLATAGRFWTYQIDYSPTAIKKMFHDEL